MSNGFNRQGENSMEKRCWELNPDCMAKKTEAPCPVYNSEINCWEYDWVAVLKTMPQEEQMTWKKYILEKCPECGAFMPQMHRTIERVKTDIPDR